MTSVGVSAPGQEIFAVLLGSGDDFGMEAGAYDELRAGIDGGLGLIGGCDRAGAEQEIGAVGFLELLEQIDRAWNGHGDFDNRDTARNHGINNCAALRNALRTENRNETDAFDDLLGCFSHGFLELHKNYRAMRAEPPWIMRSTSASVAMLVSPGVVMASAP